jgi:RNA polymerase sigma-70 factor (ECF subfamily)
MISPASDQSGVVTNEQRLPRQPPNEGDPGASAFDELYKAEFPYVWRTLRRLGVAPADIEDLVHDLFVVVHRRLEDYDRRRPIRPWLFGIAFRLASENRRRARNRHEVPTSSVDPPAKAPTADAMIESDERRRLVLGCLQVLSLDQRAVLILVDIDGEAPADVAASLKIPIPTVYSRLRVARGKFAAAVRRARLRQGDK